MGYTAPPLLFQDSSFVREEPKSVYMQLNKEFQELIGTTTVVPKQ